MTEYEVKQLQASMAWLTECNLATLELLEGRKSSSAHDIKRQRSICDDAVLACHDLRVPGAGPHGKKYLRLAAQLERLRTQNQ